MKPHPYLKKKSKPGHSVDVKKLSDSTACVSEINEDSNSTINTNKIGRNKKARSKETKILKGIKLGKSVSPLQKRDISPLQTRAQRKKGAKN